MRHFIVLIVAALFEMGANRLTADGPVRQTRPLSAPVSYKDSMLILRSAEGVAAVIFTDRTERGIGYRYRYLSRDRKTTNEGSGKVFERYTNGVYDGGDLFLKAGPIEIEWSEGGDERGWVYYTPETHSILIANAKDFDDRDNNLTDERVPKLDLSRFLKPE